MMDLYHYMYQFLRVKGKKPSEMAIMLGFSNAQKAINKINAFLKGEIDRPDIHERFLNSSYFNTMEYRKLYADMVRERDAHRLKFEQEEQKNFEPHVHVVHLYSRPSSIFGPPGEYFRIALPVDLLALPEDRARVRAVRRFLTSYIEASDRRSPLISPFGPAVALYYRHTYFRAYEYEVLRRGYTGRVYGRGSFSSIRDFCWPLIERYEMHQAIENGEYDDM